MKPNCAKSLPYPSVSRNRLWAKMFQTILPRGEELDELIDCGTIECEPLFSNIAALLDGTLPAPPKPAVLQRTDGHALFYRGKPNTLFGDPEDGKIWIALAACAETLVPVAMSCSSTWTTTACRPSQPTC